MSQVTIPAPADFHVHLREGKMMEVVTPHLEKSGIKLAYVMPNLVPPIKTGARAIEYKKALEKLAPSVEFYMTLYLHGDMTPEDIQEAHRLGIKGVKSYPRGVTTNSDGGIGMEGYEKYYPIFEEMQKVDMVLNLHGEAPSDVDGDGTCVMNAEERFLPHLKEIATRFPKLRIVLEHCTTAASIELVKTLPSNVAASITAHHLSLTIDDVVASSLSFCKPVAKTPADRRALLDAVKSGDPHFFLGSDSAPHPAMSKLPSLHSENAHITKLPSACAAGVYTVPYLLPTLAYLFEKGGIPLDRLAGFASEHGRAFYRAPAQPGDFVTLTRGENVVSNGYALDSDFVIPFLAGKDLGWKLE